MIDTNGQGHSALAGFLKVIGADILICGGIGGGAQLENPKSSFLDGGAPKSLVNQGKIGADLFGARMSQVQILSFRPVASCRPQSSGTHGINPGHITRRRS